MPAKSNNTGGRGGKRPGAGFGIGKGFITIDHIDVNKGAGITTILQDPLYP